MRQDGARTAATIGLLLVVLLPGCAQVDKAVFDLNMSLAENVFEPVNKAYTSVVPAPVRKGLRHMTDNLRYTDVMVNNLLQGKVDRAFSDAGRMAVNWVCFAGLFDAATDIGIPKYDEDFGQTLGVHGFGPGPYFNVPFIGPSTLRDVTQYPFRIATNPLTWTLDSTPASLSISTTTYFFQRFDDVQNLDPVREAVDPYAFVKKAYLDRREFLIHDGNPPGGGVADDAEIDAALEGLDDLEGVGDTEGASSPEDPERAQRVEGADDLIPPPEAPPGGLDDLVPPPEGPSGDFDDLIPPPEGPSGAFDDLIPPPEAPPGDFDDLIPPPEGPERARGVEGLPPPQVIRRPTAIRKVLDRDEVRRPHFPARVDEPPPESRGDLPPPVVTKRTR